MRWFVVAAGGLISFLIGFAFAASASEHSKYPDGCDGPCLVLASDVLADAVLGGLATTVVVLVALWAIFRLL